MPNFETEGPSQGDIEFKKPEQVSNDVEVADETEKEPGIANPELAEYRVELSESATFQDLIDMVRFEFGDIAADKVISEIKYQTQQEDSFRFDLKILDMTDLYEDAHDAQYWLPVILG